MADPAAALSLRDQLQLAAQEGVVGVVPADQLVAEEDRQVAGPINAPLSVTDLPPRHEILLYLGEMGAEPLVTAAVPTGVRLEPRIARFSARPRPHWPGFLLGIARKVEAIWRRVDPVVEGFYSDQASTYSMVLARRRER